MFRLERNGNRNRTGITCMLTLSTAHLSPGTRVLMSDAGFVERTDVSIYGKSMFGQEFGWFVYTDTQEPNGNLPEDLEACIRYALARDCGLICFDRDAEPVGELPAYGD